MWGIERKVERGDGGEHFPFDIDHLIDHLTFRTGVSLTN